MALKDSLRIIIFEANTPAGKAFDVGLIVCILVSVVAVLLDSVAVLHARYGDFFLGAEWIFTIVFTVEYLLRLWCIGHTARYARSFYGIVDLLGILPTYVSLFVADTQYLLVIRILRVLRVFRVLRMVRYVGEAELLSQALIASPSIIRGPINGMRTAVPTATIGTRAAAKLTSPRAVPTITGRNGAHGARLERSRPMT